MRHRKYEHHLHNLRNVKPSIDTRDPRRPRTSNATAARKEEERNNQIMHENTILLNKLSRILTREAPKVRDPLKGGGLNGTHKRGERERIDRENQALLRRLQDVRPSVNAEAQRQHYELHLDLLARHQATWTPNPFLNNTAPNPHARRPGSSASATSGYAASSGLAGAAEMAGLPAEADAADDEGDRPPAGGSAMDDIDRLLAGTGIGEA